MQAGRRSTLFGLAGKGILAAAAGIVMPFESPPGLSVPSNGLTGSTGDGSAAIPGNTQDAQTRRRRFLAAKGHKEHKILNQG